jgi:hypothetical protein
MEGGFGLGHGSPVRVSPRRAGATTSPPAATERLPALLTFIDVKTPIDNQGRCVLHELTAAGTQKPRAGSLASSFMQDREEINLHKIIDNRATPNATVAAVWESFGLWKISKTTARAPGQTGTLPRREKSELVTELQKFFNNQGIISNDIQSRTAVNQVAGAEVLGDGPAISLDVLPYPLTVSQMRGALRRANQEGKAKGVVPIISPPTIPHEWRVPLAVLTGLCVTKAARVRVEVAGPAIPEPTTITSFDPLVVNLDSLDLVLREVFAAYDKQDQATAHSLTPAQEYAFWILFCQPANEAWASEWQGLMDHANLDGQRFEEAPAGGREPPRAAGTRCFNALRVTPQTVLNDLVTIYKKSAQEFNGTIVPGEQAHDVKGFFEATLSALPPIGEGMLQAAFSKMSSLIGPILRKYKQSGCYETAPPENFVTDFRPGPERAMMVALLHALETLAGGVDESYLVGVLQKDTAEGISLGDDEDGTGVPPVMRNKAASARRKRVRGGARGARRRDELDDEDEDDPEDDVVSERVIMRALLANQPPPSVWAGIASAFAQQTGRPAQATATGDGASPSPAQPAGAALTAAIADLLQPYGGDRTRLTEEERSFVAELEAKRREVMRAALLGGA